MNKDIVDRIDELVDEQLAAYPRRSGYDWNVSQGRCFHCGGEFHGLPITEQMRHMRFGWCGCEMCIERLADYRADADDSAVWCPGSAFIGPWATPDQLRHIRKGWAWKLSDHFSITFPALPETGTRHRPSPAAIPDGPPYVVGEHLEFDVDQESRWTLDSLTALREAFREASREATTVPPYPAGVQTSNGGVIWGVLIRNGTAPSEPEPEPEPEPDIRIPQQRALPRPSTTEPMWAIQPNRRSRRRNR